MTSHPVLQPRPSYLGHSSNLTIQATLEGNPLQLLAHQSKGTPLSQIEPNYSLTWVCAHHCSSPPTAYYYGADFLCTAPADSLDLTIPRLTIHSVSFASAVAYREHCKSHLSMAKLSYLQSSGHFPSLLSALWQPGFTRQSSWTTSTSLLLTAWIAPHGTGNPLVQISQLCVTPLSFQSTSASDNPHSLCSRETNVYLMSNPQAHSSRNSFTLSNLSKSTAF